MVRRRAFLVLLLLLFAGQACVVAQEEEPADVGMLIQALVHPDASIRQSATRRLREAGLAAAGELVQSLSKEPSMYAAVSAGSLLADIGPVASPAASQPLFEMLEDPQTENWRWSVAANVLGQVDPPSFDLLPTLVARLETDSPLVHAACVAAIKRLGATADESQRDQLADARRGLLQLLEAPNGPLREILLDGSSTVSGQVKFKAPTPWLDDLTIIEALHAAGLDSDEVRQLLVERLGRRHSEQVQFAAARRLLELGNEGKTLAAPTLAAFIANPLSRAHREAIRAAADLGRAGAPVAEPLATVLGANEEELREEAARSLGAIGAPASAALPELRRAVERERLRSPRGRNVVNVMQAAITNITASEDDRSAG